MHYWTAFVLGLGIFFMNVEVEVWKTIDGYEDYQVSNLGRVKSLLFNRERILKNVKGLNGYLQVGLRRNKTEKKITVHVLVAMMFHGHKPNGYKVVVDHIDNNKLNNRADNLQIITNRENSSKDKNGGASNYVGVHFDKENKKWRAGIYFSNRHVHLGSFKYEIEAKNAYDKALNELNQGLDLNVLYPKWRNKTSKYKYVCFFKRRNKWMSIYKNKFIGYYETELEAYQAVQNYIKQLNENKKL